MLLDGPAWEADNQQEGDVGGEGLRLITNCNKLKPAKEMVGKLYALKADVDWQSPKPLKGRSLPGPSTEPYKALPPAPCLTLSASRMLGDLPEKG